MASTTFPTHTALGISAGLKIQPKRPVTPRNGGGNEDGLREHSQQMCCQLPRSPQPQTQRSEKGPRCWKQAGDSTLPSTADWTPRFTSLNWHHIIFKSSEQNSLKVKAQSTASRREPFKKPCHIHQRHPSRSLWARISTLISATDDKSSSDKGEPSMLHTHSRTSVHPRLRNQVFRAWTGDPLLALQETCDKRRKAATTLKSCTAVTTSKWVKPPTTTARK